MSRRALEHLGRVIGGTDASGTAYPFAAFLMIDEGDATAFCGGTIIARQWILTAGHCVVDTNSGHALHTANNKTISGKHLTRSYKHAKPGNIVVGVGSVSSVGTRPLKVSKVYVHPQLNLDYFDNDVALLKLKKKLKFTRNVQPIRIDSDTIEDGLTVTGIGWGKTSLDSQGTADVLQQVDLTIGNEELCHRIRPEFTSNDGNYICVTTPDGRDTCSGDSGGPLLRRCGGQGNAGGGIAGSGEWIQLGITSYGDSLSRSAGAVCAGKDSAGFYTHAAKYIDYISKTTGISREGLSGTCSGSRVDFKANSAPPSTAPLAMIAAIGLFSALHLK
ncbi:Plasma kallikrein [Coemansia erecta]|nr:Plasma kallikrein [Coemansia sp. RSA 2618]KAJ2828047.1 Plasma kallikrein [Coemansia erecta]